MGELTARYDPKARKVVIEKDGRFDAALTVRSALDFANHILELVTYPARAPSPETPPQTPARPDQEGGNTASATLQVEPLDMAAAVEALRRRVAIALDKVDGDRAGLLDLRRAVLELSRTLEQTPGSAPSATGGATYTAGGASGPRAPAGATGKATTSAAQRRAESRV